MSIGSAERGTEADDRRGEVIRQLFTVMVFMLSSAKLLVKEPKEYGPYRLIDAAGRLAAAMTRCGLADETVKALGDEIEEERYYGLESEEEIARFLDRVLDPATRRLADAGGPCAGERSGE